MGVYTIARDDVRNARRSPVVLGVVGVFAALVALVFVAEAEVYDDAYRTLFDVSALVAYGFPLFVAPLTYLAIAGDRSRGTVTFTLGLPNTRGEYVLAKYVSRVAVAVAAVVLGVLVGFAIAAATFANGADPGRFATFAGVSVLYAAAIAGTFLAVSTVTAERSRAMFGVVGAFFLLVFFWNGFLPVLSLETVLDTVESVLGITFAESTRALVGSLSPTTAYFVSLEPVYDGVLTEYGRVANAYTGHPDTLAYRPWFGVLVMTFWAVVPTVLGYLRFRSAELES